MKKLRFVFTLVALSMAAAGCSTPITAPDDCDPDIEDCEPINPTGGSINPTGGS